MGPVGEGALTIPLYEYTVEASSTVSTQPIHTTPVSTRILCEEKHQKSKTQKKRHGPPKSRDNFGNPIGTLRSLLSRIISGSKTSTDKK